MPQERFLSHSPMIPNDFTWYRTFMQIPAIAFVVVDARDRSLRADELRAAGVTDLELYLSVHPEEAARLRNACIMDLNETAIRMFGGSHRDQFLNEPTARFFDPLCPALVDISKAYFNGESSVQQQVRTVRLDGTGFDSLFAAILRGPTMTQGIWLAAFFDITDGLRQRTALDSLRDELAHVSRISMLGELSASITHELGQPLSSIEISAVTAQRMLSRPQADVASAQEIVGRIAAQAARAREIVDRMRSMAARRPANATPVTVRDLVRDSLRFVRHEFERNAIGLSTDVAESRRILFADQIQIQQVLVNVLMNAIQMMRESLCEAPHIAISGRNAGPYFVLEIRDTGPGISADRLGRIFESFYTSREDGLGLGLSVCRTIIEAHDGSIRAGNREDRTGAVFTIELPMPT